MERHGLYNEKMLLLQIAEGDETAFRQVLYHYSRLLAPYVLGFTKSKEKTEEIVQDVFLQLWISRGILPEI
ncbi:MAG: RNA polymerase subunit sigma-70, partial [Flavitalea sp.]